MAYSRLEQWYRYLESQFESESQSDSDNASPSSASASTPEVQESPAEQALPSSSGAPTPASVSNHPIAEESLDDSGTHISIRVPHIFEFLPMLRHEGNSPSSRAVVRAEASESPSDGPRLRKRKRRPKVDPQAIVPPDMEEVWAKLPRYLRYLAEWTDDSVTQKYYPARIRESREELIARLTDPVLTLEETARLLGVCPATIRRYTDRGWLRHFRTEGNQRRFRLSDIVAFLEEQAQRRPMGNRNANKSAQEDRTEKP